MVAEVLHEGRENAIPANDLVIMLGLRDCRELRRLVSKERMEGALILSSSGKGGGYYLPANREEVQEYCRMTERRGKSTFRILKSAHEYLGEVPGQLNFAEAAYGEKPSNEG